MFSAGDIVLVDFGSVGCGCEEVGYRPALVISSDLHNQVNRSVIVIPLTKQTNKAHWHEHYLFQGSGINGLSVAMCEHVREIDCSRIHKQIGYAEPADLEVIINLFKSVSIK